MLQVYQGLDKSMYGNNVKLSQYFSMRNDHGKSITNICLLDNEKERKGHPGLLKTNVTYAGL